MTSIKRTSNMHGKADTKRITILNGEMALSTKDFDSADSTPIEGFTSFPERLMQMLDSDEFRGIVYWSDYGDFFCINTKEFIEKVLDVYFQGSKFESFVRKLNRWGFKRTYHPDFRSETIGYQHPMFRKGRPELLRSLSNCKKQQSKIAISSLPKQGTVLQVVQCLSTKTTGGTRKITEALTNVTAPALKNINALQGQQQPTFPQSMTMEASQIHSRELLVHKVSPSSAPMQQHRQQQQQQIESMLASRQQQQQLQQQQQQLQQRLRECLSQVTGFPQSLPLSLDSTALELLRSANRLTLSLPILPNFGLASSYEVLASQSGQLHYPNRHFL